MQQTCTRCNATQPEDQFRRRNSPDLLTKMCSSCRCKFLNYKKNSDRLQQLRAQPQQHRVYNEQKELRCIKCFRWFSEIHFRSAMNGRTTKHCLKCRNRWIKSSNNPATKSGKRKLLYKRLKKERSSKGCEECGQVMKKLKHYDWAHQDREIKKCRVSDCGSDFAFNANLSHSDFPNSTGSVIGLFVFVLFCFCAELPLLAHLGTIA